MHDRTRAAFARYAPLSLALLGAAIARVVGHFALDDFPHAMDEIAYRLQAETFAQGHLTAPLHVPRAAFAMWFVDDRWATYSIFPPGWPAVLALPARLGVGAWVNPALHGATALVAGAIGRRLGGSRARIVATAAYALAPQAIVLAASFMSHTLVAFLAAVALWSTLATRRYGPWLGGAALGLLFLTRPLCAAIVALSVLGLVVRRALARRARVANLAVGLLLPLLAGCAAFASYNQVLTGSPTRFPQSAYFDEHVPPRDEPEFFHYHPGCNDLGFGPGHGCDYGIPNAAHDVANALSNTGDNLRAWLFLAGGGPLVFLAFAAAFTKRRGRARLALVALVVPAALGAYALYWYAGTCYGARFYHAALVGLVVVAACGALRVWEWRRWVAAVVAVLWLSWNAVAIAGASRELSRAYWGTDARFSRVAAEWRGPDALVMVAFRHDWAPDRPTYFWTSFLKEARWSNSVRALSALSENGPALDRRVVFAKFHPALVRELRERFPDRELWLYVVEDDTTDTLVPFDGTPLARAPADLPTPPENFDSFLIPRDAAVR